MKKVLALILTLMMMGSLAACGGEKATPESYHKLLESRDSVYYYEADAVEEFPDDGTEPEEMKVGEARDGNGSIVVLNGEKELDNRQIETKDSFYYVYDPDKIYTREDKEDTEPAEMEFVESSEMKFDGKTYQYSEYQEEYEMETYVSEDSDETVTEVFLYRQQYLVDEGGELYAVISIQEQKGADGEENTTIYKKTERITKLTEGKYPEGIFDIPDDYHEAAPEDEEYAEGTEGEK